MAALKVEVVTPDAIAYQAEADFFSVLSENGWLGILPRHAPLIAVIWPCVARLKLGSQDDHLVLSGGFMEVKDNQITLLVTACEKPSDIDVNRAQSAYDRATERIARYNKTLPGEESDIDITRAEAALARAKARLKATATAGAQVG